MKRKPFIFNAAGYLFIVAVLTFIGGSTFAQVGKLQNIKQLTNGNERYSNPVWAPDGKKFIYTGEDLSGLFYSDEKGIIKKTLTTDKGAGFEYKWAADGASVLYRGTTTDGTRQYVALVGINGHKVIVSDMYTRIQPPHWNYNTGKARPFYLENDKKPVLASVKNVNSLAVSAIEKIENSNQYPVYIDEKLYLTDATGKLTLIHNAPAYNIAISPDGKKIAFNENDVLMVMNFDGSAKKQLGYGHKPTWKNNYQLIYQITTDDGYFYTSGDLFIINIDGSNKVNITNTSDKIEMNPNCASDGKKLLFIEHKSGQLFSASL